MTPISAAARLVGRSPAAVDRHPQLRRVARWSYAIPGVRALARGLVRLALQWFPLCLKSKQRLYNFFASDVAPLVAVPARVRAPGGGWIWLSLNLRDDLSRIWYFWGYAGYERPTVNLLRELLRSRSRVFDVGANVGYYTTMAAEILKGRGSVHAFEPWPEVYDLLEHNVGLNRHGRVTLNRLALADSDGAGELFLPGDGAWTNASLVRGFAKEGERIVVPTMRFDSYCARNGVTNVDLVKIDVEGAELRVLRGMGGLLDAWRPDIILEVLPSFADQLDRFFAATPYRKFRITARGLEEMARITADPQHRDVYLSCAPISG